MLGSLTGMMAGILLAHSLTINVINGGTRLIASGMVAVVTSLFSLGRNH